MNTPNPNPASGGSAQPKATEAEAKAANKAKDNAEAEVAKVKDELAASKSSNASTSKPLSEDDGERRTFELASNIRSGGKTIAAGTPVDLTKKEHAELFAAKAIATDWPD